MEKLIALSRATGGYTIHFNKAQYGASEWAVKELEKTPMHPSIKGELVYLFFKSIPHFSCLPAFLKLTSKRPIIGRLLD